MGLSISCSDDRVALLVDISPLSLVVLVCRHAPGEHGALCHLLGQCGHRFAFLVDDLERPSTSAGDCQSVGSERCGAAIVCVIDGLLGVADVVVVKRSVIIHDIVHAVDHRAGRDVVGILDHELARVDVDDAPLLRTHQLYGQVVGLIGIVALLLAARHQDSHAAQCCYRL